MNHSSLATIAILCLILAGCKAEPSEDLDFGASVVAEYVFKGRSLCRDVSIADLDECAQLDRGKLEFRAPAIAAATALDAYEQYSHACHADLGYQRCEEILNIALGKLATRR